MHTHLLPFALMTLGAAAQTASEPALQRTRAVWFAQTENPIAAEVGMSFEALPWDAAAKQAWDGPVGTRLPLANAAWAELATFTDLTFGKTTVKGGAYYVVLEKAKNGLCLGLLDASKVRALQLPPGLGKNVPLVASIPLQADAEDQELRALGAAFETSSNAGQIALRLQFGPHTLRAKATVKGAGSTSPLVQPDPRRASRTTFSTSPDGRELFATVDHGQLVWTDEHRQQAVGLEAGDHWRLGKDWATTLDTNTPLLLGGKKLAVGSWHLTMRKTKDGWDLLVSSANADYASKLDGFAAEYIKPVLTVALQRDTEVAKVDELRVAFVTADKVTRLVITFAGQQFATTVALS